MRGRTPACLTFFGALIVIVQFADGTFADALVVTKAMQASTIAEIFIEETHIRVEIEVGTGDLNAFANILPDKLYEKITGRNDLLVQRIQNFLQNDWVIYADGQLLSGRVERAVPATRVVRDDVTGEPLIEQPNDAEVVIRLTLRYELTRPSQTLSLRPPLNGDAATANIGFVCYHKGLPVNDFRYLSQAATVDLDWDDPWYSRFRHPNLRRQFDAPLSAFLYIEPYEVRKEIIIRPRDLQSWIDLPLRDDGTIPIDQQEELKRRIAEYLSDKNPVLVDGQLAVGRLDRIHFVHRSLRTTGIIEPPVDLDATSAMLGVIFVYPIDHLPEEVSMRWELFSPRIQSIPAATSDEAGGLPTQVKAEDPVLTWKNYLTNPTSPEMLAVASPPTKRKFSVPLLSILTAGLAVVAIAVMGRRWFTDKRLSRFALATTIVAVTVSVLAFSVVRVTITDPLEKSSALAEPEARGILSSILHNVYRSFDHHDEILVYDRLARSISGELLSDVYLETRKNMEVKNQGGLRISVKEVLVTELESLDDSAEEPTFRCRWRVSGWIGHWGHVHRRENEHVASITIGVREKLWKITDMEMLDAHTVAASQRGTAR